MKEYFKINNIEVGFANHPTEGTIFTKGSLNSEVFVRKGKLRISFLTPAIEITDEIHNGLLDDPYFDNLRNIDYFRMVTYSDLEIPTGKYNTQIICPYGESLTGFETYNFPEDVNFHGVIDVQEGYVHIKGVLKSRFDKNKPSIPIEVLKTFDPKPLLPKRKKYTWKEALEANPLEVYSLRIEKGIFDEFPPQILSFKNLEDLWIGGQAKRNFVKIPDDFYLLEALHTIQIYGSKINHISEKIKQLQNLEEFTIQSSEIDMLPDSICDLPNLTTIDLKRNKLSKLPTGITSMHALKELVIQGNKFTELPKKLNSIFSVDVERKYKKMYMDLSYKSKNLDPIDETLFNLFNYPDEKLQLDKEILAIPELNHFKNLITDYSTMATYLILEKNKVDIPIGSSKVGGSPDLPRSWKHPTNKNGLFYIFHAQINCKEIAPYQKYLPRTGMLYFFVNDEEYADEPIVLYTEENDLIPVKYSEKTEFTDSDFDNNYRKSVAVSFQNSIALPVFYNAYNHGTERYPKYKELWENEGTSYKKLELLEDNIAQLEEINNKRIKLRTHSVNSTVFSQHESPQEIAAAKFNGEPEEWVVLLNMESADEFDFWDAGTLTYCIHKKDLAIKDFSKISASIESS